MSFDAGSLASRMTLDVNPFRDGFIQANSLMQLFPGWVTNFMANPLLGVIGLTKQVGSAFVGVFNDITNRQDNLRDLARQLNVPIEFLDAMDKAAELEGANVDSFADSLHFLRLAQVAAARGSEAEAAAFKALGVEIVDTHGQLIPLDALTWRVIDGFHGLKDGAIQAAIAQELLGRGSRSVLNFFNQGRGPIEEYVKRLFQYHAVTTQTAADSADSWNDLTAEVGHAWTGMKMMLVEPLRDALTPILLNLLEWVRAHPNEIKAAIDGIVNRVIWGVDWVVHHLPEIEAQIKSLANTLGPGAFGVGVLMALNQVGQLIGSFNNLKAAILGADAAAKASMATGGGGKGAAVAGGLGQFLGVGGLDVVASEMTHPADAGTNQRIGRDVGGGLGAWGGMKGGAAAGAAFGPWGMLIGGALGGLGGWFIGSELGGGIGGMFDEPEKAQKSINQMAPLQYPTELQIPPPLDLPTPDPLEVGLIYDRGAMQSLLSDLSAITDGAKVAALNLNEVSKAANSASSASSAQAANRFGPPQAASGASVNIEAVNLPAIDMNQTALMIAQALKPELDRVVDRRLSELRSNGFGSRVADTV